MAANSSNPVRPLLWAAMIAQGLGALCVVCGLILTLLLADSLRILLGAFWPAMLAVTIVLLVPGILYSAFASSMRTFRLWAVVATLAVASLHAAFFALLVFMLARGGTYVGAAVGIAALILLVLLITYCARSLRVIRLLGPMQSRGFEPVIPKLPQPATTPSVPRRAPR